MSVFIDTSAFYAILDDRDANHEHALDTLKALAARNADVVCTNYILLESIALLQHRLGISAVRTLQEEIEPVVRTVWIEEDDHRAAVQALLTAGRRQLSLVDCTSFHVMRRLGIRQAFAFDQHFAEQGFECLPRP